MHSAQKWTAKMLEKMVSWLRLIADRVKVLPWHLRMDTDGADLCWHLGTECRESRRCGARRGNR